MTRTGANVRMTPFRHDSYRRWRGGLGPVVVMVAAGGVVGALARYALSTALPHSAGVFPAATFLSNVIGCLLIGVLMTLVSTVAAGRRLLRPFFGVGVLGAFTTFSTYAVEVLDTLQQRAYGLAFGYLIGSVLAALLAVWAGETLTRLMLRRLGKER